MIIKDETGKDVAYVSEEYWEALNAITPKKSANTPRQKV